MTTIGQCIIDKHILSVGQADEVCRNLDQLYATGIWDVPAWATELAHRFKVDQAHSVVQLAGWEAAAKAYQRFVRTKTQKGD